MRSTVVGNGSKPFIGLNDASSEGTLVWADSSTSGYRVWRVGEPSNTAAKHYVRYDGQAAGTWEIVAINFSPEAIVEIKPVNGEQAPIRVPTEQPTIQAAIIAANQTDAAEVVVAAGPHPLPSMIPGFWRTLRKSNCVFTRCGPGNQFQFGPDTFVSNSIFWNNTGEIGTGVRYCIGAGIQGPTNLNADPKFVNDAGNDFRLQSDSPAIDRGAVADFAACLPEDLVDFAGNPRAIDVPSVPNYTASVTPIDLGVFEVTPVPCPGDLNGDGLVNDADFQIFTVMYDQ
ncbi:MAG: C-type lectin domain-containing protein, partial [Phycisphaerae bacterium]